MTEKRTSHTGDKRCTDINKNKYEMLVALAGNPNVGKSTIFNALTGMRQHTGNWTGKTVGCTAGEVISDVGKFTLVDLPGTYSLLAHSAEEEEASNFISREDVGCTVVVCDASCLERNLILVLQILDITDRALVCVNLMDEAEKKNIKTDCARLEELLGVPVVATAARSGKGLEDLCARVLDVSYEYKPYRLSGFDGESREEKAKRFACAAEYIASEVVTQAENRRQKTDRALDRLLTGRLTGFPIMICLLAFILWLTVVGANYPSELLAGGLFWIQDRLLELFDWMSSPEWLKNMLVLGVYRTLAWVVSVMLPPMAIFFPLFTFLEDFGYLPRVAFNLDRCFKRCNACGKQALTMCMGLGCNAAGVVGCRIIDSDRERNIAILTNSFMPCNGRFPTLIAIASIFFLSSFGGIASSIFSALALTAVIVIGIIATFICSKILSKTVLRGQPSSFTLELPSYRSPKVGQLIVRSLVDRTAFVLARAVAVAAPAGLLLWLMANIEVGGASLIAQVSGFLDPFARIMGLDGVILLAFILALPANEIVIPVILMAYTASGALSDYSGLTELRAILVANGWTVTTAICITVFMLMHWPCSTTLLTIRKETGKTSMMLLGALIPTVFGILICIAVNLVSQLFF